MRYRTGTALVGAAALLAALVVPTAALASHPGGPTVGVIAEGLETPRGVTIGPDGAVYVVEAGTGGPCVSEADETEEFCFGQTGAVTRIADGSAERIVEGLLSFGNGANVEGPSDIAFRDDGSAYIILNLSADPAEREAMPDGMADVAGRLLSGSIDATFAPFADIAGFETAANPDAADSGGEFNSNPFSVAVVDGGAVVVDASGNSLVMVDESGEVSLVAVFPMIEVELQTEGEAESPQLISVQSVPTAVTVGPDGALYVGELTGGPFPVGAASVWRVTLDGEEPTRYATGFTSIMDLAFGPDGTLYVAEIVHDGLMGVFAGEAPPIGAVLSVPPGGGKPELIVSDERIIAPGGIAVNTDGTIYLSIGTMAPGVGSVLEIEP